MKSRVVECIDLGKCEWFDEWTGQIVKEQEEEHSEMTDLHWRLSCYSSCSVAATVAATVAVEAQWLLHQSSRDASCSPRSRSRTSWRLVLPSSCQSRPCWWPCSSLASTCWSRRTRSRSQRAGVSSGESPAVPCSASAGERNPLWLPYVFLGWCLSLEREIF